MNEAAIDETQSNPPYVDNLSLLNVGYTVRNGRLSSNRPRRTKLALIGFEEANLRSAPYDDESYEVWGLNMGNRMGIMHDSVGRFRADRWFDVHPFEPQSALDMAWINQCPTPIYLPTVFGTNPNALAYPLREIEDYFREIHGIGPYWASSFAYAVALAIFEGFETIGLFGINLHWGRERIVERGNLEFWIGLAIGVGIKIEMSPGCRLLTHPARYGFEYHEERDQVILDCAEHVRQLLAGKEFKAAIELELQGRQNAIEDIARYASGILWRVLNQNRNPVGNHVAPTSQADGTP